MQKIGSDKKMSEEGKDLFNSIVIDNAVRAYFRGDKNVYTRVSHA